MRSLRKGFGTLLGRAIDRWPGGGQRAFASAVANYADRNELKLSTSYRTLLNYLQEKTRPSLAWVEAAAAVLDYEVENLITGQGPERPTRGGSGLRITASEGGQERTSALINLIVNNARFTNLPIAARMMLFYFCDDYFVETNGWSATSPFGTHAKDVRRVLDRFFGLLLETPATDHRRTMALAAALTSAAYTQTSMEGG